MLQETVENESQEKKKMSRWRAFFFNRKAQKEFRKEMKKAAETGEDVQTEKQGKDARKLTEYLSDIETHLGEVNEQNKLLLFQISTLKENNDSLLKQVEVLSKNNELLSRQFEASQKREKLAKIIAIISSALAIGFSIYKIIEAFLGK